MNRKSLPKDVELRVLTLSRRRCALCFGLNRDDSQKMGQIAHLDRDPANSAIDNLAFLCLEHHNVYDSRQSQAKGFTLLEVKTYRDMLYSLMTSPAGQVGASGALRNDFEAPGRSYLRDLVDHLIFAELRATRKELVHVEAFRALEPLVADPRLHDETSIRLIWSLFHHLSIAHVQQMWQNLSLVPRPEFRLSDLSPLYATTSEWFGDPAYRVTARLSKEISQSILRRGGGRPDTQQGFFRRVFIDRERETFDEDSKVLLRLLREQLRSGADVRVAPLSQIPQDFLENPREISIVGSDYAYTFEYNEFTHYIKRLDNVGDMLDGYRVLERASVPAPEYVEFLLSLRGKTAC